MFEPVKFMILGPIAQSVEQLAFNQWVPGSRPGRITNVYRVSDSEAVLFRGGRS